MKKIFNLSKTELKILFRDKYSFGVLFIMPMALVMILSLAMTDIYHQKIGKNLEIAILSSNSMMTDSLVEELRKENSSIQVFKDRLLFEKYLADSNSLMQIIMPKDLGKTITGQSNEKIILQVDPLVDFAHKKLIEQNILMNVQSMIINQVNEHLEKENQEIKINNLKHSSDLISYAESKYKLPNPLQHTVPGWTLFAMFFITIPISNSFFRDRKNGIFKRMLSLNISKNQILLGKLFPYLIVNIFQFLAMYLVGLYFLPLITSKDFSLAGPSISLAFTVLFCSITATTFGLFVTSIAYKSQQASGLGALLTVILALLGGIMIPHFAMPQTMQFISKGTPFYWAMDAFMKIFVKNSEFIELLPNLTVLFGFSLVMFLISFIKLQWSNDL